MRRGIGPHKALIHLKHVFNRGHATTLVGTLKLSFLLFIVKVTLNKISNNKLREGEKNRVAGSVHKGGVGGTSFAKKTLTKTTNFS